jgi:sugar diacid utilization regulator
MDIQQKKAVVLDALLEHKGIEHILSAASHVLNNPILMVDRLGVSAGMSVTETFTQDYWNAFSSNMPYDWVLEEVERRAISSRLLASDDLQLEHFDTIDHDVLGTRVRDRLDVLGYIGMTIENPIEPDDGRVLVAVARMLSLELVYQSHRPSRRDDDSALIEGLVNGTLSAREIQPIERRLGISPSLTMRLLCISYPPSSETSLYLAKNAIEANTSCLICGTAENSLVVVFDDAAYGDGLLSIVKRCSKDCQGIGVGFSFKTLAGLAVAYRQARATLRVSTMMEQSDNVFLYERAIQYCLIEAASRSVDIMDFVDPAILHLRDYDTKNGSELAKTLRVYIDSGCNMSACAEIMFTHRNTIRYRISRIAEMANIDFDDYERRLSLAISFRALEMATLDLQNKV